MKKTMRCVGAVLAGLAVMALSAAAAERSNFETYVVRQGDTLSGIAGRIFGDTKRWREILKANPQVKNANTIYPGDALLVPMPETAAPPVEPPPEPVPIVPVVVSAPVPEPVVVPPPVVEAPVEKPVEPPAEPVRPVPVVNPALYRSAGYITDRLPELAIVATLDDRILIATDDQAIVNAPVSPGQRFAVVRADRRVFHPTTGVYLGWLTRVLGAAEVTCRGEKTSTVVLSGMRDAAGVGDYLVPADPNDVLKENALAGRMKPGCLPPAGADGVIVAFDEDRLEVGEQEFAYLDRGTDAGVTPGRRFAIYRPIAPEGQLTVGELQILRASERTATGLVTTSVRGVKVGDLLRAR